MKSNADVSHLKQIELRVERLLSYYRSSVSPDHAYIQLLERRLAGVSVALRAHGLQ